MDSLCRRDKTISMRETKGQALPSSRRGQDCARLRGSHLIPTRHSGYSLPAQALCNNLAVIGVKSGLGGRQKPEGIVPWQL
jgi:hypothetical protein